MSMTMELIRHIAGLYSGKAIKGDFTQVYITGNEIWMAQQILALQQVDQATHAEIARVHPEQAEGAPGERDEYTEFKGWLEREKPAGCVGDMERGWMARAALAQSSPAPESAAVLPPFAEKVLAKLRRFYDCASDFESGGVDIGRHWLDLLTQLGLLNRVQRSPALWEISQQGEDLLEAPVAQAGQVPQAWLDVQAERRRQVEVGTFIDDLLERRKLAGITSSRLITNPDGVRLSYAMLRNRWQESRAAAMQAAIDAGDSPLAHRIKQFRFSDIQPKAASEIDDLTDASKLLGHSKEQITKTVYRRVGEVVSPTC
ncbi:hypothetical protein [Pseudomonas citronellolis]|uniref:hypothetical protein n=1 Tax=Pseudomonas citronellolis TaxID=53408 RepID=UPI00085309CB|nr:hypothetical protein [Pseudomonas humi]